MSTIRIDPPDEDPGDPGPDAPVRGRPDYSRAPDGPRDAGDIRVPVSAGERAEITRRARAEGVGLAEYLRRRALG